MNTGEYIEAQWDGQGNYKGVKKVIVKGTDLINMIEEALGGELLSDAIVPVTPDPYYPPPMTLEQKNQV